MAKVVANVFGDSVIRKALQYSSAVQAIGGASRLTAQQQQQVNTVVTQAIQKYQALGQQAPAHLHAIAAATQQVNAQGQSAFGSLFSTIAGGVTVGNLLASGLRSALSGIVDGVQATIVGIGKAFGYLVNRGAEVDQIRQAFVRLSRDVGQVPEKLLAAGREGIRGLATDFDIMKSANQAMLFGLKMTEGEFHTLTRTAQTLGRAMGMDATKSLNDLIVALGRTSPRILDNLGIIVKIGEANIKYADSIGKTVKELSAAERQNAFYVEAMRVMEEKVKSLDGIQLTFRDRIVQVQNSWTNFTDSLAVAVSLSPALNAGFDVIAKAIMSAFGTNQVKTVQTLMNLINRLGIITVQVGEAIGFGIMAAMLAIGPMIDGNFKNLELLTILLNKTARIARNIFGPLSLLPNEMGAAAKAALGPLKEMEEGAWNLNQGVTEARKGFNSLSKDAWSGVVKLTGVLHEAQKKMKENLDVKVEDTKIIQEIIKLQENLNEEGDKEVKLTKAQQKELEKKRKKMEEIVNWTQGLKLNLVERLFDPSLSKYLFEDIGELWRAQWDKQFKAMKTNIADVTKFMGQIEIKWFDMFKGSGSNPDPVKKQTDSLSESLKELTRMFTQLKQVSGDTWGGMMEQIASTLQLMELGAEAGKQFKNAIWDPQKTNTWKFDKQGNPIFQGGFKNPFANGEGKVDTASAIGGAVNMTSAAVAGYGALMQATSSSSRGRNMAQGAMTGASIGNSIVPGYGALVGAAVGLIIGALRGKALRDEIRVIGKEWGLELGDEMAKEIVQVSKEKFKGDRRTGELFLMDKIIAQGGGINSTNRNLLEKQLLEVFDSHRIGKLTTDQTREILEKNFTAFADYYAKTGKVISKEMREILRLNGELHTQSEEIKKFVTSQMDTISKGVMGLMAPQVKQFEGIAAEIEARKKDLADAQKELDALSEKEGGAGLEDSAAARQKYDEAKAQVDVLTAKQAQGAATSKEAWETAGLAALKAINAASKQGLTYDEAFSQAGDALTVLVGLQKDLGLTTENAALAGLIREQELTLKYADRITQVQSLNETTVALVNLNAMDVEMLGRMQTQGQATYDTLIEAGFTQEQTLRRMIPFYEALIQSSQEQGVELDATTQGYIQQAAAMGLFGDKAKSVNDLLIQGFTDMKDGIQALIEAIGGKLPEAWVKAGSEGKSATQNMKKAVDDMKEPLIDVADRVDGVSVRFGHIGRNARSAADDAVEAFDRVNRAAEEAQYSVDGVSYGHSPGGLKDIKAMSRQAAAAMEQWRSRAVNSARAVESAVNSVNQAAIDGQLIGPESMRPISLAETYHLSFKPNVIDGTDLQDMVENEITTYVISAIEKNRKGALTRARQALGV